MGIAVSFEQLCDSIYNLARYHLTMNEGYFITGA